MPCSQTKISPQTTQARKESLAGRAPARICSAVGSAHESRASSPRGALNSPGLLPRFADKHVQGWRRARLRSRRYPATSPHHGLSRQSVSQSHKRFSPVPFAFSQNLSGRATPQPVRSSTLHFPFFIRFFHALISSFPPTRAAAFLLLLLILPVGCPFFQVPIEFFLKQDFVRAREEREELVALFSRRGLISSKPQAAISTKVPCTSMLKREKASSSQQRKEVLT